MKRLSILTLAAVLLAGLVQAGDAVTPASCTITNTRGDGVLYISGVTYYDDATLRLTNCVLYSGTSTNSDLQGLSNVTVEVSVGSTTTNIDYSATIQDATSGTWYCDIVVPSFVSVPFLQVKIEDENTNSYIYPWKKMLTQDSL